MTAPLDPTPTVSDTPRMTRLRLVGWTAAAALLLIPLIGTLVSDEVAWSVGDFVLAGGLLLAVGVPPDLAVRRAASAAYRWGTALSLAGAVGLLWANGAVGIIGSAADDVNVLFLGVVAVGAVGALAARFRAGGMALALGATALAQAAVAVGALAAGWVSPATDRFELVALWLFVAVWAGAAALFRRAAREAAATR